MQNNLGDSILNITVIDVIAKYFSKCVHDENTNKVTKLYN